MRKQAGGTDERRLVVETAFGTAAVVYRESPFQVVEVVLPRERGEDLPERVRNLPGGSPPPEAVRVAALLADYFAGRGSVGCPEGLDWSALTPAMREVLHAVADIPYGETRSYGEIARQVGRPKAARFVGSCMAANPFPVFVPCHRVLRKDGALGGFGGGLPLKERMLALERERRGKQG